MPNTITNPVEFNITDCLSELQATLDAFEGVVKLDERIDLLEKAVMLSSDLKVYFEASDHLFNQISEIKLLATDVFGAQISLLEPKS